MSVDVDQARTRLLEERERVSAEIVAVQEDLGHSLEDSAEVDGNDSHLADSASETLDRGIEISLEDNAEQLLGHIDEALGRIEAGTYGSCDRCGGAIDAERLEALPYATRCIECKRAEERG